MQRLRELHVLAMGKGTSELGEPFVSTRLSRIKHLVHKKKRKVLRALCVWCKGGGRRRHVDSFAFHFIRLMESSR